MSAAKRRVSARTSCIGARHSCPSRKSCVRVEKFPAMRDTRYIRAKKDPSPARRFISRENAVRCTTFFLHRRWNSGPADWPTRTVRRRSGTCQIPTSSPRSATCRLAQCSRAIRRFSQPWQRIAGRDLGEPDEHLYAEVHPVQLHAELLITYTPRQPPSPAATAPKPTKLVRRSFSGGCFEPRVAPG